MRRVAALWLCALAIALARPATVRAAVADYLGKPVVSVTLTIEGQQTTDESLGDLVTSMPGHPLSMTEVRETIGRLFSLGRFEDVQVDASPAAGGVALRYDLTPVHPVTRITFTGNTDQPGVDTGALRRAVVDRYGVSPSLGRADEMARVVADQLADVGYLHARVDPHAEIFHHPDRATLVFNTDPGPRSTIASIVVDGDAGVSRGALLDMLDVAQGDPYRATADRGPVRPLPGEPPQELALPRQDHVLGRDERRRSPRAADADRGPGSGGPDRLRRRPAARKPAG